MILFFAGWGMDEQPFLQGQNEGRDLLICYDYRELSFDEELLKGYESILVVAWSMGVWVAHHTLSRLSLPIVRNIAVNGTLYPLNDEKGIPAAVFWGTLRNLDANSLQKFRRRMCKSPEVYKAFLEIAPTRSLDHLKNELEHIGMQYMESVEQGNSKPFHWDAAIIGTDDRIFLPENQQRAWQEEPDTKVHLCDTGHYLPGLIGYAVQQIHCRV